MRTVKTNVALFAGIIGWITFLLINGILSLVLTNLAHLDWQPAAIISGILCAIVARHLTYIFARNKGVGFCVLFLVITAATQWMMGYGYMTLSCSVAAVFICVFWLIGLTNKNKPEPQTAKKKEKKAK